MTLPPSFEHLLMVPALFSPDYWSTRWSFHLWRWSLPASFTLPENLDLPKAILTLTHNCPGQTYPCSCPTICYPFLGVLLLFLGLENWVYGQRGHQHLPSNLNWLQADLQHRIVFHFVLKHCQRHNGPRVLSLEYELSLQLNFPLCLKGFVRWHHLH